MLSVGDFAIENGSQVPEVRSHVTEKIHVLDQVCSGMGYSAVDREFNVNEKKWYILDTIFQRKHT